MSNASKTDGDDHSRGLQGRRRGQIAKGARHPRAHKGVPQGVMAPPPLRGGAPKNVAEATSLTLVLATPGLGHGQGCISRCNPDPQTEEIT
jgi:hypothetical protein